jgi:transposase
MFSLPRSVRIFVAREPADMRKGFDGLAALVRRQGADVFNGHLFVFVSKRRDRIKILMWDSGGFVMYYKRLEKCRFKLPRCSPETVSVELDSAQLAMLLDGIDVSRVHRPEKWSPSVLKRKGIDIDARL